jgi:hypothetical protein
VTLLIEIYCFIIVQYALISIIALKMRAKLYDIKYYVKSLARFFICKLLILTLKSAILIYFLIVHFQIFTEAELDWIIAYSRPFLTQSREEDLARAVLNPDTGVKGKRKVVMKTVQAWFNDVDHDWLGSNVTIIFPNLVKLTRKLELATQLIIRNKYSSTEYQTTNYGLGGICESHIDPYGYLEGAPLYENPLHQRLIQTGDMFATIMGYLNKVDAGGATAFSKAYRYISIPTLLTRTKVKQLLSNFEGIH